MTNIREFPVVKVLSGEEALQIVQRFGAKTGVIIYDCPCGCGRVKCIEIGEPDTRDMLFYAENLRNYAMEEYCEALEESETDAEV